MRGPAARRRVASSPRIVTVFVKSPVVDIEEEAPLFHQGVAHSRMGQSRLSYAPRQDYGILLSYSPVSFVFPETASESLD